MHLELADIDAIQQNFAALNIVKTQQQLNDRRLSRAGMPHDRQRLPRLYAK